MDAATVLDDLLIEKYGKDLLSWLEASISKKDMKYGGKGRICPFRLQKGVIYESFEIDRR